MQKFTLQRRRKAAWAVFFPEPVRKERETYGLSTVGTDARWMSYRLVSGDLLALRNRAQAVAQEYSPTRFRHPTIDQIRLFQEAASVRNTGLVYLDYAGRIDTISRETVSVMNGDRRRAALPRDSAVGFRGITTMSEQQWSPDKFALEELARARVQALIQGSTTLPHMTTNQPWVLRAAAEQQLTDLATLAWTEYTTDPTPDKLAAVAQMEATLQDYMLNNLRYIQHAGVWEYFFRPPFPDRATALGLWETDRIDSLNHQETEPWWGNGETASMEVTMFRRAYLSTTRLSITLITRPTLHALMVEGENVAHHFLTYGEHPAMPLLEINPNWLTTGRGAPMTNPAGGDAWDGHMEAVGPWRVMTAEDNIPEPKMRVHERVIRVTDETAQMVLSSFKEERPTLMPMDLNGYHGLSLSMPRMHMNVLIDPLFDGGTKLTPIQEGNAVSGWATRTAGKQLGTLLALPSSGFLPTPISGRPLREGVIQEILPLA